MLALENWAKLEHFWAMCCVVYTIIYSLNSMKKKKGKLQSVGLHFVHAVHCQMFLDFFENPKTEIRSFGSFKLHYTSM